ncbi:hypothetical protein [Streptomyces smyrnaeus]|uniref:hypothetical protein n=1 Tax=Streptomyces smyrnaeus TaxID=1387713 RepID=UPI0036C8A17E
MAVDTRLKVDIAFDGPLTERYAKWTDVTEFVRGVTTKRGRTYELDEVEAGTARITLDNSDGRFTPGRSVFEEVLPEQLTTGTDTTATTEGFTAAVEGLAMTSSDSNPYRGARSLRVASMPETMDWENAQPLIYLAEVSVTPGREYRLGCAYRKINDSSYPNGALAIMAEWYDASGNALTGDHANGYMLLNTSNWKTVSETTIAPLGAVKARLKLVAVIGYNSTVAFFDSFTFKASPPYYRKVVPNRQVQISSVSDGNYLPVHIANSGANDSRPIETWDDILTQDWFGLTSNFKTHQIPDGMEPSIWIHFDETVGKDAGHQLMYGPQFYTFAPIEPGEIYTMSVESCVYKGTGPGEGYWYIQANDYLTGAGESVRSPLTVLDTVGEWKTFRASIRVPVDWTAPYMHIGFRFPETGVGYTDEFPTYDVLARRMQIVKGTDVPEWRQECGYEPIFHGWVDRWPAKIDSPLGLSTVELPCTDDFRIIGEALLGTPYQAAQLADPGIVAYYPFNDERDPQASGVQFTELAGNGGVPGTFVHDIDGDRPITWGGEDTGFVGLLQDEGPCVLFGPPPSNQGSVIDITSDVLDLPHAKPDGSDNGFQLSLWFKCTPLTRPADGEYWDLVAQVNKDDLYSTAGIALSLNRTSTADRIYFSWNNKTSGTHVSFPRNALFDQRPHFVRLVGDPASSPTAARTIRLYVDEVLKGTYNAPAGPRLKVTTTYLAGRWTWNGAIEKQYVGYLSHVAFSSNGRWGGGYRYTIGRRGYYGQNEVARMKMIAENVTPWYDTMKGDSTGAVYLQSPTWNAGTSALTLLKQAATDAGGLLFTDKMGFLYYRNRWAVQDGDDTRIAVFDYAGDTAPEPGLTFDSDVSKVINEVRVHRLYGGTFGYTDKASRDAYGRRSLSIERRVTDDRVVQREAAWILNKHKDPIPRCDSITWNVTAMPGARFFLFNLDIGDKVVLRNLPNQAPARELPFRIESIEHDVRIDGEVPEWLVTLTVSPDYYEEM